ncbi:MAG TPA: radical SAM protein [Bacteroidales bacterium]|nr:radical SAM protein [Bacteroidales bacterium]
MLITLIKPPQIIVNQAEEYLYPAVALKMRKSLRRLIKKNPVEKPLDLWYPMGVLYIASFLQANGHEVEVIDLNFQDFSSDIKGVIGVSFDGKIDGQFLDRLHAYKSNGKLLIAGGFDATFHYSELLDKELIDIIVLGEGELTILELLSRIENNEDWKDVKGIAYKGPEGIIINRRTNYCDLETLPIPNRELVNIEKYRESNPIVNLIASRGCPRKGRCGFCKKTQHNYRIQSVEKTIEEMRILYNYGYRRFYFGDDYFMPPKDHILKLCDAIRTNFPDIKWRCLIHVVDCDETILRTMQESGCEQAGLGVESFNQETLDAIRKDYTISQLTEAIKVFRKIGMNSFIFLLMGLPKESPRLFLANLIKYSFKLKPYFLCLSILNITHSSSLMKLPGFGAPFQRNPDKFGIHFRTDHDEYCGIPIEIKELEAVGTIKFSSYQRAFPFAIMYVSFYHKIIRPLFKIIDRLGL